MPTVILTTRLSELNRLYGVYYEVAEKKTANSQEAQKAWIEYETYATIQKRARHVDHTKNLCSHLSAHKKCLMFFD